jgi:hypothetical protein
MRALVGRPTTTTTDTFKSKYRDLNSNSTQQIVFQNLNMSHIEISYVESSTNMIATKEQFFEIETYCPNGRWEFLNKVVTI